MTRRNSLVLAIIALVFAASPSCVAQQVFWARVVPGSPREIWLHGRELWRGSEYDSRAASLNIDGFRVPIPWDRMSGASGHDANRGLPYVQRFILPSDIPPSASSTLTYTRNDGAVAMDIVAIPAEQALPRFHASGQLCELDAPINVAAGATFDGGGQCFTWRPGKQGTILTVGAGAVVTNLGVYLPPGNDGPAVSIKSGSGTILSGVVVANDSPRGVGIFVAEQFRLVIRDTQITANRGLECGPSTRLEDCTYYRLDIAGPRGSMDAQAGRAFQGSRHLVAWCRWHDIDRGPTVSPWGAPNDRCLWWECEQRDTGVSQGASEGLLFEAFECAHGPADIASDGVIDFATTSAAHCRPGNFVIDLSTGKWSRIKTSVISPGSARLTTETPLPSGRYDIRVGNAQAQNTIARCRFSNGRSGLWFFGAAVDNAVVQCDFRDLDSGMVTLNRRNAIGCAVSFGLIDRYNQFRRCGVDRRVIN